MENAMLDPLLYPQNSDLLIGKVADLKIEFWDAALDELGDLVDIIGEGDDYGTQQSQLISPDQFRQYYKPHFSRVLEFIKSKNPELKIMFHSCGNVRPVLPDFVEMGVDILNPVHVTSAGMEPKQLKKDFGRDMVFWGGGIETQNTLPLGSPQDIKDDVKRNIDALAPGGGFVFSTVHNIQAEVPPQNIEAMWEALQEYGIY
jgi:uroporphyrinogen decarboxylase